MLGSVRRAPRGLRRILRVLGLEDLDDIMIQASEMSFT